MKVAIVGAGICGLYLAWKLSKKGEDITVFEKRGKIGKEACSGLFSERILEFIPESKKLIQNQINSALIHFPGKTIKIEFARKFLVMSHRELDRLTAKLAQKSGSEIILNHSATRPGLVAFGADRMIGCDGANSAVRKWLKMPEPNFRLGIQGFIPQKDFSNYVETWPVKEGFIWKIPRGWKTEYGIIAKPKNARKILEDFLAKNNIRLEKTVSALIPQGLIVPKNNNITLCGDAAGLTKPWSGGGVIWGLKAADLLLKNFPDFVKYQIAVKKGFSRQIILSRLAAKAVYFLGFKASWLLPKNIKIENDFLF